MGLRHLPVLGPTHAVCGIITRHDLLRVAAATAEDKYGEAAAMYA